MSSSRVIVVINLLSQGLPREKRFNILGHAFHLIEHRIGWDFETAEALIRKFDGCVDGIALSGVRREVGIGKVRKIHARSARLIRVARKTPVYLGDDVREMFANWTLRRLIKEHPHIFSGKKCLFHCAVVSPFLPLLADAGARVFGADALLLTGAPLKLKGERAIRAFLRATHGVIPLIEAGKTWLSLNPARHKRRPKLMSRLRRWISQSDVFVTFGSLLDEVGDFSALKGRILIVDFLEDEVRARLQEAGVSQIIEFIPRHEALAPIQSMPFSVLTAVIDQTRLAEDSPQTLDDFTIRWTEKLNLTPNGLPELGRVPRRCAFVVHALSQADLWRVPAARPLAKAPPWVRDGIETAAARLPVFHYGTLKGVVSQSDGQEVICDIYALMATPKQLLSMDEERVYSMLVRASEMAKEKGAGLLGLGAYTKVVGDAGVTVARRAAIPVTTGNSYSASTTLWAARQVVERLGFVRPSREPGGRLRLKAMIIGATGSIGRVAALLVSLVAERVVLVAPRADKLLELRQEVLRLSPGIEVITSTRADSELADTDLIVTATSNQRGTVLDIEKVKPGAVICDCSRPADVTAEHAALRPDVLVIESGEVDLPGVPEIDVDIGLPKPSVYACLAETVLLTMEGRYESFSLSRDLSWERVKEIYKIGLKHGARLSAIQGPLGLITEETIERCRALALEKLRAPGLTQASTQARQEKTPASVSG